MSLLDAAPRQYENNDSSPAALAFFAEFDGSRQSTPATSPPPAPHDPPAEVVTDVIVTLVDGRSDALAILQATAARLSFNLLSTRQGPAVQLPDAPIVPTIASLDDLAASFAQWRDHARQCHRLLKLASSFRASRLSSSPPIVSTSTWEERDAALRRCVQRRQKRRCYLSSGSRPARRFGIERYGASAPTQSGLVTTQIIRRAEAHRVDIIHAVHFA